MVAREKRREIALHLLALLGFTFFFSLCSSYPNSVNGTAESDFAVLLTFKSSSDAANSLISWSDSSSTYDPCSAWLGVTCHPKTRRVTKLVLNRLNLTGSLRILAQLTQLRLLSLHHNRLSSTPDFTSWPKLRHVYLSHNHFTGKFPAGISRLPRLHRLDLSYNGFSGKIPISELAQLPYLLTLRLEFNSFNGSLGTVESTLSSLSDFNVSGNDLNGKIPVSFAKFPVSSFTGNGHLCGKPLPTDCGIQPATSNPTVGRGPLPIGVAAVSKNKKGSRTEMVLLIIMADAVAVMLILLGVGFYCYKKKYKDHERKHGLMSYKNNATTTKMYGATRENVNGEMVCFDGSKGFAKVDDLLKASAEMLGKGDVGTTYKVVMDGGDVVVVKRVRERLKRVKEIDGFLRAIGGLRHSNVVSLRAFYSSKEELFLVYDFLQNGSLHSLLHGNRGPGRTPLDWPTRLKFAAGSAEGLAFIHGFTKFKLFHGHLTSSNVIIDHMGNACISDIGLHNLLQLPSSSSNAYKAPELPLNNNANQNQTKKYTQKCDVYSFGVILLEILTGKMATSEEETSLVTWVQRVAQEEWTWDVFDFELVRHKDMEQEMTALLKVAMLCLASSPKDRPKMNVVHKMIDDIQAKRGEGNLPLPG